LNPGLPNDTPALYPLLHELMLWTSDVCFEHLRLVKKLSLRCSSQGVFTRNRAHIFSHIQHNTEVSYGIIRQ
jgi:hypothetical protein